MTESKLLLLNRSAAPSAALSEQVRRCGLSMVHLPLIHAQIAQAPDPRQVAHVKNSDWLLFCSPRAVDFAAQQLPGIWQLDARFGAVGAGTARRIQQLLPHKPVIFPEKGDGARALLGCSAFDAPVGAKISIFTGVDGSLELESVLRARNADVQSVLLYERVRSTLSDTQRALCETAELAVVGSASFLDALLAVRGGRALFVWVPSERVAAHARAFGCTPDLCLDSSDDALITRLKHYRC